MKVICPVIKNNWVEMYMNPYIFISFLSNHKSYWNIKVIYIFSTIYFQGWNVSKHEIIWNKSKNCIAYGKKNAQKAKEIVFLKCKFVIRKSNLKNMFKCLILNMFILLFIYSIAPFLFLYCSELKFV